MRAAGAAGFLGLIFSVAMRVQSVCGVCSEKRGASRR